MALEPILCAFAKNDATQYRVSRFEAHACIYCTYDTDFAYAFRPYLALILKMLGGKMKNVLTIVRDIINDVYNAPWLLFA